MGHVLSLASFAFLTLVSRAWSAGHVELQFPCSGCLHMLYSPSDLLPLNLPWSHPCLRFIYTSGQGLELSGTHLSSGSKPWVGCPTHNKKLTWQDRVFGLALREASHSTALSLPPPPGVSWEPYLIFLPEENESQNCGLHREVLDGPHTIKHSPRQPSPHSGLPVLEPHPLHSNPSLPPGKQHTLYLGPCSAAPSPGSLPAWVC